MKVFQNQASWVSGTHIGSEFTITGFFVSSCGTGSTNLSFYLYVDNSMASEGVTIIIKTKQDRARVFK